MPNTHIIGADKMFGLDDLNTWVKENEMTLGPIVAIGDGGDKTGGEFNVLGALVQAKWAEVSLKVGAVCVISANRTLVCEGQAYIAGVLLPVCVSRPN